MLPSLLAADGADSTPYVISILSACVAGLAGLVTTIALAKANSVTKKLDEEKDERHKLALVVIQHGGQLSTLEAKSEKALTKEIFELRTANQDRVLAEQTGLLQTHDKKLDALVEDVVGHEERLRHRSSSNMPAMRPPIPRSDSDPPKRRTDGTVELAPGPMRPKLKSQQFK